MYIRKLTRQVILDYGKADGTHKVGDAPRSHL